MSVNSVSISSISDIVLNAKNSHYYDYQSRSLVKVGLIERIFRAIFSFFGWMNSTEVYCRHLSAEAVLNSLYNFKNSDQEGQSSFITKEFYQKLRAAIYDTSNGNALPFNSVSKDFKKEVKAAFQYEQELIKEIEGEKKSVGHTLDNWEKENAAKKQSEMKLKIEREQREQELKAARDLEEGRIKAEMAIKHKELTRNEQLQKANEADCKNWVFEEAEKIVNAMETSFNASAASPARTPGILWSTLKSDLEIQFKLDDCRRENDYRSYSNKLIEEIFRNRASVGKVCKLQLRISGGAPGGPATEEIDCREEEHVFQIMDRLRNRKIKSLEIDGQRVSPGAQLKTFFKAPSALLMGFGSPTPPVISATL